MERDEIVCSAVQELTPYAKKKGVTIDYSYPFEELRFYGYSKDSTQEIKHMMEDLIAKKREQ